MVISSSLSLRENHYQNHLIFYMTNINSFIVLNYALILTERSPFLLTKSQESDACKNTPPRIARVELPNGNTIVINCCIPY